MISYNKLFINGFLNNLCYFKQWKNGKLRNNNLLEILTVILSREGVINYTK